jgi:hypothetical protein
MTQPLNLNYATPATFAAVAQAPYQVFHARGIMSGWKGDRLWRVYVHDGKFYFIKVGGSRQSQAAVGAQFGLLGALLMLWLRKRDQKKTAQKINEIFTVPPEQLIGQDKESCVFAANELTKMSVEPGSFLAAAKFGRWVFHDPKGKKRSFTFEDLASGRSGMQHLCEACGEKVAINGEWDDVKGKFVKKRK